MNDSFLAMFVNNSKDFRGAPNLTFCRSRIRFEAKALAETEYSAGSIEGESPLSFLRAQNPELFIKILGSHEGKSPHFLFFFLVRKILN